VAILPYIAAIFPLKYGNIILPSITVNKLGIEYNWTQHGLSSNEDRETFWVYIHPITPCVYPPHPDVTYRNATNSIFAEDRYIIICRIPTASLSFQVLRKCVNQRC